MNTIKISRNIAHTNEYCNFFAVKWHATMSQFTNSALSGTVNISCNNF